jgi:hypothetical protein
MKVFVADEAGPVGVQPVPKNLALSFREVLLHFNIGYFLGPRIAIAAEDYFSIQVFPPLSDVVLFRVFLLQQRVDHSRCLRAERILALILDEGQVALFEVLGDDVANKAGKVAGAVAAVEYIFEQFSLPLVD